MDIGKVIRETERELPLWQPDPRRMPEPAKEPAEPKPEKEKVPA